MGGQGAPRPTPRPQEQVYDPTFPGVAESLTQLLSCIAQPYSVLFRCF